MITLQNFIAPNPEICTEQALYAHVHGAYGRSQTDQSYVLTRGASLAFDSYFNLLNLTTWAQHAKLPGLFAEVRGRGKVSLQVTHAPRFRSWDVVYSEVVTLAPDSPHLIDLSHFASGDEGGLLFVSLTALDGEVEVHGGRFAIPALPEDLALPRLTVSITTFKREEEVRRTVARLDAFLQTFAFGDQIRVQVVDNGQSAEIPASAHVTPMDNANLGGAGGFARGLLEAEAAEATHCLFMDDDASFDMENIARTYMFLALARDPKTAVSGAMITNTHKWSMWENGAWFDGSCRPMYNGTDLREVAQVVEMEHAVNHQPPATLYGGWWFFAFPVAEVKRHPFPFFVRGDDINFSLANDFKICTINGVVSFQDDFTEKESAQTLYLDLRNHLVQHLTVPEIERGPLGLARVAIFFTLRSLLRLHYSTAEAQLLAWEDVMQGPDFFDQNIDMSARRATIKELSQDEAWKPISEMDLSERRRGIASKSHRRRHHWGLRTFNGHFWPFYRSSKLVLPIAQRSLVVEAFGAKEITYLNTAGDKAYRVTHSRKRFFAAARKMACLSWKLWRNYDQIKAAYGSGYDRLTTKGYWQKVLNA